MFRLRTPAGNVVVVGLVEKGHGTLKAYMIRDMVAELRAHDLIPEELEP